MKSINSLLNVKDASLADCIERLAKIIKKSNKEFQRHCHQEILSLINNPDLSTLAIGLAGKLNLQESAEKIYKGLQKKKKSDYYYNTRIIALGQLEYERAVPLIENFVKGETRAAATHALLRISPERATKHFKYYVQQNPDEGARIVSATLYDLYERYKTLGVKKCFKYIPKPLLVKVKELMSPALARIITKYMKNA